MTALTSPGFHSITVTGDAAGNLVTTIDPPPRIRITARKARRLLLEVVAEAGRHIVTPVPGKYVYDGYPMCLVARVLYRAGMTVNELSDLDVPSGCEISKVPLPKRVRMSEAARLVLVTAQMIQDVEDPWGEALDEALAVRPYHREQLERAA